jgi:hypothetical protein
MVAQTGGDEGGGLRQACWDGRRRQELDRKERESNHVVQVEIQRRLDEWVNKIHGRQKMNHR